MLSVCVFALLTMTLCEGFNYTSCPSYSETVELSVQKSFSLDHYIGRYYELYVRDFYEILCPDRKCVTSDKTLEPSVGEYGRVSDVFTVQCTSDAKNYPTQMYDNVTTTTAMFRGYAPQFANAGQMYPNFIVATSGTTVKVNDSEQYAWLVEFQCVAQDGHLTYLGVNAECYTPHPSAQMRQDILNAVKTQLQNYGDAPEFFEVDHTNCTYVWPNAAI